MVAPSAGESSNSRLSVQRRGGDVVGIGRSASRISPLPWFLVILLIDFIAVIAALVSGAGRGARVSAA